MELPFLGRELCALVLQMNLPDCKCMVSYGLGLNCERLYTNGNSLNNIYIHVHSRIFTVVVDLLAYNDVVGVVSREYGGALSALSPKFFITSKKVEYWKLLPRVS